MTWTCDMHAFTAIHCIWHPAHGAICKRRQTPNKPCSLAKLRELGVLYWKLDADNHETDPRLAAIRKVRNYSYTVGAGEPVSAMVTNSSSASVSALPTVK